MARKKKKVEETVEVVMNPELGEIMVNDSVSPIKEEEPATEIDNDIANQLTTFGHVAVKGFGDIVEMTTPSFGRTKVKGLNSVNNDNTLHITIQELYQTIYDLGYTDALAGKPSRVFKKDGTLGG